MLQPDTNCKARAQSKPLTHTIPSSAPSTTPLPASWSVSVSVGASASVLV